MPSSIRLAALAALMPLLPGGAAAQISPDRPYPEARTADVVDTLHGVAVADPYRWMEDLDDPELVAWARAQDALVDRYVAEVPERDAIRRRILAIHRHDRLGWGTVERGGRLFYLRAAAGEAAPVLMLREGGRSRVLHDPARAFPGQGLRLLAFGPSRSGRRVAVGSAPGQSYWQRLRILDVDGGSIGDEVLTGIRGGVAWRGDEGFYYVRYDEPEPGRELEARIENARVLYHRVGTPQADDRLVFARPDRPDWSLAATVTPDGRWLAVGAFEGGGFSGLARRLFLFDAADPRPSAEPFLADPEAGFALLGNDGDRLLVHTTAGAPAGRIVAIDADRPGRDDWVEIVPEGDDPIAWASVAGERLVVGFTIDAIPVLRVFDLDGRFAYEVDLPDIGSVTGFSGRPDADRAVYIFNGLYHPSAIYGLDLATGRSEPIVQPEVAFEPDAFETRQVFYRSADGTRVPMFVAHRKGLEPDGTAAAFLYAYGAAQWIAFPWFQPNVIAWMEMGGVYALPGIRGGGEYGDPWYRDGVGRNKQNGIDDYLAAARWLVEHGWAAPDRLVANGGSASGVLPAAAILQRPELFAAATVDLPALDMIRFTEHGSGVQWTPEYGSPDDPDDFAALLAYSPYHNVAPGTCYPPTLVTVGERDELAVPLHGYKWVARMQAAQGCDEPILLQVVWGGGHNTTLGTTPEQAAENQADQWAFLIRALGLEPDPAQSVARP